MNSSFLCQTLLLHSTSPNSRCTPMKSTTSTPRVNFHSIESIINHSFISTSDHSIVSFDLDNSEHRSSPSNNVSSTKERKSRRKLSDWQNWYLRQVYSQNRYPTAEEQEEIGQYLSLPSSSIRIWFQNYRARHGKK